MSIGDLIREIKQYNEKADIKLIRRAYNFSESAHKGQKRASGEDFIIHPLEAAKTLAKLKLDDTSIVAALLHDVVEDTNITLEDIEKNFGKEVAELVDGVTKITELKTRSLNEKQAETIRKMLVASTKDLRVIIIKLADKLHNMKTLRALNKRKQRRIAREVLDVYAPLAYRLGLANVKWQLEDLAFRILEPEIYKKFKGKVARKRKQREKDVEDLINILKEELGNLKVEISGRPKHFYSIYEKMKKKNRGFEDVYDLLGLRVITKDVKECYDVIGVVHNLWQPLYKHFSDYIANPKPNMYQSLHTIVLGPRKQAIEVQVRTGKMDELAEEGIAAHWRYKDVVTERKFDRQLSWLKEIFNLEKDKAKDFLEKLKVDLFGDHIFCYTPKGDIIELPKDSTPVDFAYSIHSDMGDKCVGARVNKNFISLRHKLQTGDRVEILTSEKHIPSRDWLKFVRSSKAVMKIKHALSLTGIPGKRFFGKTEERKVSNSLLYIEKIDKPEIKFAKCCGALPGDRVVGFKLGKKVVIHKSDCSNLSKVRKNKIKVKWLENFNVEVKLKINALDRVGLFADILNTVASTGTSIKLARAKTLDKENAECELRINFTNLENLRDIIDRIYRIADVKKVRIE